jgi:GntR family transcriptional repressor for pyruvate dehydrogenase complex
VSALAFEPIRKQAIAEEVSSRLLSLIQQRQLTPGDKLPSERDLAASMEVSRSSLREALRALAMMNIIETRQGDGTYVTSLEPGLLVEHLDFVLSLDRSAMHHLFEVRRIVEVGIAEFAARRATDAQIAELEELLEKASQSTSDAEAFLRVDLAIHDLIAAAAGNPLLSRIMSSLSRLGLASRQRTGVLRSVREQSLVDHAAIVDAIRAQDPEAAARAMMYHLDHVEKTIG